MPSISIWTDPPLSAQAVPERWDRRWPARSRPPSDRVGRGSRAEWTAGWIEAQWNESPQAQDPVALGLSIVKPCFSMVSTKSIVAPLR